MRWSNACIGPEGRYKFLDCGRNTNIVLLKFEDPFAYFGEMGSTQLGWSNVGKGDIPNEKNRLPPLEVHFGVGGCGRTVSAGGTGQE